MDLSIIILTMNESEKLKTCLESLQKDKAILSSEIVVIDNASNDGTIRMLESDYPEIKIIRNSKNRGVGPARNQGLKIAKGEYILMLDNDTEVMNSSISKMLSFMQRHEDVGLLGAKLINPDGSLQLSCRRFPIVFQPIASRVTVLQKSVYFKKFLGYHLMKDFDHSSPREVDYVIGACQLIRREAFEHVGFYDERIFFGPEDCDYALRMWQNGWKVIYFPEATIMHQYCRRTTKASLVTLAHIKGMLYFFWKHKYLFRPPIRTCSVVKKTRNCRKQP
jgi:N-acetylglucosaminyl-diphospho-decaprenol L-rhamnosyltransferase